MTPALAEYIALPALPDMMPRRADGRKVNYSTIWMWARNGLRGVRLRTVKIGGRLHTTMRWIEEFQDRCTYGPDYPPPDDDATATKKSRRPRPGHRASIAAARRQRIL